MSLIAVQVGFSRTLKEGQLVTVTLNEKDVDREKQSGMYLTGMSQRHTNCWYLADLECKTGDVIVIDVKTGVRQKGVDEKRTFRKTLRVDETFPVNEIVVQGVGFYTAPLAKGRFEELASVSKQDERRQQAESQLDDARF